VGRKTLTESINQLSAILQPTVRLSRLTWAVSAMSYSVLTFDES